MLSDIKLAVQSLGISPEEVLDAFPCTPLQEGVLHGSSSYYISWVWHCEGSDGAIVNPLQLEASWKAVVALHSILSTVFISNPRTGRPIQVVLAHPEITVLQLTTCLDARASPTDLLIRRPLPVFDRRTPKHVFTICNNPVSASISCRFDICHALFDRHSMGVLLKDLITVYNGQSPGTSPPFSGVVHHIMNRSEADTIQFWTNYLDGIKPCQFPVLPDRVHDDSAVDSNHDSFVIPEDGLQSVTEFCKENNITRSVFIHLAWALTLFHFTGMDDICFGYLASGRDVALEEIDQIVGPTANLMVERIDLSKSFTDLLGITRRALTDHRRHQQTYLASVFHHLKLPGSPFNTVVNLIRGQPTPSGNKDTISFQEDWFVSPHEYVLGLEGYLYPDRIKLFISYNNGKLQRHAIEEIATVFMWAATFLMNQNTRINDAQIVEAANAISPNLSAGFLRYVFNNDSISATEFWSSRRASVERSPQTIQTIPTLPDSWKYRKAVPYSLAPASNGFDLETIAKVAWAVVLAQKDNTDEVLFGTTIKSNYCSSLRAWGFDGSSVSVIPCSAKIRWGGTARDHLSEMVDLEHKLSLHEPPGLHWLRQFSSVGPPYSTGLVFDPQCLKQFQEATESTTILALDLEESAQNVEVFSVDCCASIRSGIRWARMMRLLSDSQNLDATMDELAGINDEEVQVMRNWNNTAAKPSKDTIPDLFRASVQARPSAVAVDACDGSLTYAQLDQYSTTLALQLLEKNIEPGAIAILCFEKSLCMSIAMLAVAKAGITGLGIDPLQPEQRLQTIVAESKATVAISSRQYHDLSLQIGLRDITTVEIKSLSQAPIPCQSKLPQVSSDSVLYSVFTSGSSGKPKGVLISHQNYSTAAINQHQAFGFDQESRVLDFASYAFDAAWFNLLHTVTSGGCLCVPSNHELRNDLARCVVKYKVSLAFLTPSVCRGINREALRPIKRLLIGGEAVLPVDTVPIGPETTISIVYGPSECTPMTMLYNSMDSGDIALGHGVGVNTWIVSPDDPEKLCPIGVTGELCIEGAIVGLGYLGDETKTRNSFLDSPSWHNDPQARFYRTGDLVRYTGDDSGTITFVDRKDTQVKIRGQRVELSEVEHHIHDDLTSTLSALDITGGPNATLQVVAETIRTEETDNVLLVVFVALQSTNVHSEDEHNALVRTLRTGCKERLSSKIPSYMIPSSFIPMQSIPITITGKADRIKLRTLGSSLWKHYAVEHDQQPNKHDSAQNHIEETLQQIWSVTLNIAVETIPFETSFTALGGDSITAMQVVADCRKKDITTTVADILQSRGVRKLARLCRQGEPKGRTRRRRYSKSNTKEDTPFPLSPIQQKFFEIVPDGLDHFNQSFLLEIDADVPWSLLQDALHAVSGRHPMLRAHYRQNTAGIWEQVIEPSPRIPSSSYYRYHRIAKQSEVLGLAQEFQRRVSIKHGPIFAADYFDCSEEGPILLLYAHHLVIDLVSWRIIWRDLQDYIRNGKLLPANSAPFQHWCSTQRSFASSLLPEKVLPFEVPPANFSFWGMTPGDQLCSESIDHSFSLDVETTTLLMGTSNAALRTEPLDIILGAYLYSFETTFTDRQLPAVYLEGHGREALNGLDVSETIGWFTTIHPLRLEDQRDRSLLQFVRQAKDTRRRVPLKGLEYFASCYYSQACRSYFSGRDAIELLVNFAGSYQQLEKCNSIFKPFKTSSKLDVVAATFPRLGLIETNMEIRQGQLKGIVTFDRNMLHQERLRTWVDNYEIALKTAAKQLHGAQSSITQADVPLVSISDLGLNDFVKRQLPLMNVKVRDIVEIYPASPLQEGILLSACGGVNTYDTFWIFECQPRGDTTKVTVPRLIQAWRSTVQKHPILRTIFAPHPDNDGFMQVVLDEPEIAVVSAKVTQRPRDALSQIDIPTYKSDGLPRHLFTVYQSGSETAFRLDINHTLLDGPSLMPLIGDLVRSYDGAINTTAPPFKDMVQYIRNPSNQCNISWWAEFLSGCKPCNVPSSKPDPADTKLRYVEIPSRVTKAILPFCKRLSITRSSFLQVAWGLVLSQLCEMDEVCFGYLASGRDAPIDNIENMVGPLANMLISRMKLDASPMEVLQTTARNSSQHLAHQHVSLARIQHKMGLTAKTRLFNTAMTLRGLDDFTKTSKDSTISMQYYYHQDPHEYELLLSARVAAEDLQVSVQAAASLSKDQRLEDIACMLSSAIECILSAEEGSDDNLYRRFASQSRRSSYSDLETIWKWNSVVPESIEKCVHHRISQVAALQPAKPAVCAWDGELTYSELESASTTLAHRLVSQGMGRGNIIPICLEKSKYMPIAALAVIKTGAAVVALDSTQPESRLREITDQLGSNLILSSATNMDIATRLIPSHIILVDSEITKTPIDENHTKQVLPESSPSDMLYLVFTSGTTGNPKGTVITHQHISTMLYYQQDALGITPTSRIYNFASYSFDVAWDDFFHAFTSGGCLCIPSEDDRQNDIEQSMLDLKANYAHITPTVLRHIDWSKLEDISVINLSGEQCIWTDRDMVNQGKKVVNAYGPAETNVVSIQDLGEAGLDKVSIGKGYGAVTWIVDPEDPTVLSPIGSVGELWIEGPLAGTGYFQLEELTSRSWVDNPQWLLDGSEKVPGRKGRLYRTGDLAQYTSNGSLIYLGRADRQVKIRGQRIELGDVEHAIRNVATSTGYKWQVAVEVMSAHHSDQVFLMAFIVPKDTTDVSGSVWGRVERDILQALRGTLPEFMIPRAIIAVPSIPMTATGKIDRRLLQSIGSERVLQDLRSKSQATRTKQPRSAAEELILEFCMEVFPAESNLEIDIGDNFFEVGGDSIYAMRLANKARSRNVTLTVKDIFQHPELSELASVIEERGLQEQSCAHTLLESGQRAHNQVSTDSSSSWHENPEYVRHISDLCGTPDTKIKDILPCTPLQAKLSRWSSKNYNHTFRTTHILEVREGVNLKKFQRAWRYVFERNPILRTRVIKHTKTGYVQVHVDEPLAWIYGRTIEECRSVMNSKPMQLGDPLVYFAIAQQSPDSKSFCFIWELHWALYDGWALRLLISEAEYQYHSLDSHPLRDMRAITRYIQDQAQDTKQSFWKQEFARLQDASPNLPCFHRLEGSRTYEQDHDISTSMTDLPMSRGRFTPATIFRAALSLVLAKNTSSKHIVFGATVTGRQIDVGDIEYVAGPAFANLPVCVSLDKENSTMQDLLERIQRQASEMTPFQHCDLEEIRSYGENAAVACDFRVLLVVQSAVKPTGPPGMPSLFAEGLQPTKNSIVELGERSGKNISMYIECKPDLHDGLDLRVRVDSRAMDNRQCTKTLEQLERVLRLASGNPDFAKLKVEDVINGL